MTNKDIRYLKGLDTVANSYPPARGFIDLESLNGTAADKAIISQNNLIIELLIQIQNLLVHSITTSAQASLSSDIVETLQKNLQSLQLGGSSSYVKPPPRKFVVKTNPEDLVKEYKKHHGKQ